MRAPVWSWLDGAVEPVMVGMLERDEQTGSGQFLYDAAYLSTKGRALDPDQLRHVSARQPILIPASAREGIPAIIADAGPDAWGRQVLAQDLGYMPNALEALVYSADDGAGNLAVGDLAAKPPIDELDLAALADALERRQVGLPVKDAKLLGLLSPDTALGGTKPKATIFRDGQPWIAKFIERGDPFNLPYHEAAALRAARRMGIEAPSVLVEPLPAGRSILLVKRFDRAPSEAGMLRFGFASALTVLGPTAQVAGVSRSYLRLAKQMKSWLLERTDQALPKLWERIVFNALVGNADDHVRNHGLLWRDGAWFLSPMFDVVPTRFHLERLSLSMNFLQLTPTRYSSLVTAQTLVQSGPAFRVPTEEAYARVLTMAEQLLGEWASVLDELQAPATVAAELEPMLQWAKYLRGEALKLSAADCAPPTLRQGKRWRWTP